MARQKDKYGSGTSWQDIEACLPAWEREYDVTALVQIEWRQNLSTGAFVEVVLYQRTGIGRGIEVLRSRQAFPSRSLSGHAGAVMHALFIAFNELSGNPWLWGPRARAEVIK